MRCPDLQLVFGILFTCVLAGQLGCSSREQTRPSYLIIAVDRLGIGFNVCPSESDDATGSGFGQICREGVRFTHAFTPSTLSAPALGSILTGHYPYQNGLRHNGGGELGTLSASAETLAESALMAGYRTLFVSGGAPLLRRTGLHQGFEVFDDNILPNSRRMHRPAREVSEIFQRWLEGRLRLDDRSRSRTVSDPFFAVLHFSDLQVPWSPAQDDSGRVRESTVRAQLEEVDDTLGKLWAYLRRNHFWESTMVVVVGLQGGVFDIRHDEIPALDLHSNMTHVTLLLKDSEATDFTKRVGKLPPGQTNYQWTPKSSTFDINVSLADIGVTLFERLSSSVFKRFSGEDVKSLANVLHGPGDHLEKWRRQERAILSESAWAKWQLDSSWPIRLAIRKGPYLYIHDRMNLTSTLYNTLTDAFEVSPLPKRNSKTIELKDSFSALASSLGFQEFPGIQTQHLVEVRWASSFFSKRLGVRSDEGIQHVTDSDQQRIELLSGDHPHLKTWLTLQKWELGIENPPANFCSQFVFGSNQSANSKANFELELSRVCPFRGAKEIFRWLRLPEGVERARALDQLVRFDEQRLTGVRIAEASHALGRIWETGSTRRRDLEGLEVLLAQPEANRLRSQLTRRLRNQPEP
jgi:hypothetical protein